MKEPVCIYSTAKGFLEDPVAVSRRMRILLNGRHVARITLSPALEEEAAVGYLAGQGIVEYGKIRKVSVGADFADVEAENGKEFERSESGDCGNWTEAVVKGDVSVMGIYVDQALSKKIMENLQGSSKVWQETGGTHSCGFFSLSGEVVHVVEDVSRHVALDKVIGLGLKARVEFGNGVIATSGRVSSSCILKCARMGIPAIVSRSAPLLEAVEAANATGITLVGFARGSRFNVYSNIPRFYGKL